MFVHDSAGLLEGSMWSVQEEGDCFQLREFCEEDVHCRSSEEEASNCSVVAIIQV